MRLKRYELVRILRLLLIKYNDGERKLINGFTHLTKTRREHPQACCIQKISLPLKH